MSGTSRSFDQMSRALNATGLRRRPAIRYTALLLLVTTALQAGDVSPPDNPQFTLSIDGPCDQVIEQPFVSDYDDGTGGADFFFDPEEFAQTGKEVPTNPPGHTWDILLTTADNPTIGTVQTIDCASPFIDCQPLEEECTLPGVTCVYEGDELVELIRPGDAGAQGWSWGLTSEADNQLPSLFVTDLTTAGTVGCHASRGPPCLRRGNFELLAVTTELENEGVVQAVILTAPTRSELPPEDNTQVICKIRIYGGFQTTGELDTTRFFSPPGSYRDHPSSLSSLSRAFR